MSKKMTEGKGKIAKDGNVVLFETTVKCKKCGRQDLISVDPGLVDKAKGTFDLVFTRAIVDGWQFEEVGKGFKATCPDCALK